MGNLEAMIAACPHRQLDAAKSVHQTELNAPDEQEFVWPASFVVARAPLDQLMRRNGLSSNRVAALVRVVYRT